MFSTIYFKKVQNYFPSCGGLAPLKYTGCEIFTDNL
jgi:hypothetical protein